MKPHEAIGYMLLNTTAITSIVGAGASARITYGMRPERATVPCVNYYEVSGNREMGLERVTYSINCRAATPAGARAIAREVLNLFVGTSSSGIYGTANGFELSRASLAVDAGLIYETEDRVYNAPIDVLVVYPTQTVT